jgi:hypothetical protein
MKEAESNEALQRGEAIPSWAAAPDQHPQNDRDYDYKHGRFADTGTTGRPSFTRVQLPRDEVPARLSSSEQQQPQQEERQRREKDTRDNDHHSMPRPLVSMSNDTNITPFEAITTMCAVAEGSLHQASDTVPAKPIVVVPIQTRGDLQHPTVEIPAFKKGNLPEYLLSLRHALWSRIPAQAQRNPRVQDWANEVVNTIHRAHIEDLPRLLAFIAQDMLPYHVVVEGVPCARLSQPPFMRRRDPAHGGLHQVLLYPSTSPLLSQITGIAKSLDMDTVSDDGFTLYLAFMPGGTQAVLCTTHLARFARLVVLGKVKKILTNIQDMLCELTTAYSRGAPSLTNKNVCPICPRARRKFPDGNCKWAADLALALAKCDKKGNLLKSFNAVSHRR